MSAAVKKYQKYLNSLGYKLAEDGIWGKRTQAAYEDAVDRGLVTAQRSTSKQSTSKPKLVPKQLSDYELMADASNKHFAQYPVEAIQDWGDYKTVRDAKDNVYTVEDIKAGKYKGNVPAYIENGVLKAGPVPTDLAYNDYVNDNALANYANKLAMDEYIKSEYSPERIADAVTGGVFHRLSPTQNARLIYDVATGGDWRNSMIYGNNGVVSDQFAAGHPYWTTAINMAGDAAVFNAGNISRMFSPSNMIANARANYAGPTPVVGRNGVYMLSRGETVPETSVIVQNSREVSPRGFSTGRGQITYGNKGSRNVSIPSKQGSPGYKGNGSAKATTSVVSNQAVPVTDAHTWNLAMPQWATTGATLSLLPKTYGPDIAGVPYHHDVVRNFHDDEWIWKYQHTPEGETFWHNGKSYIKQGGGRDRFVRMQYNDGQTPMGQSTDQVYFDQGVPVVEVPFGTPVGITRNAGGDTGNIKYNNAVNRNTGKQEKSKVTGK